MGPFWMAARITVILIAIQNVWTLGSLDGRWVDAWTAMPQLTEPANLPSPPFNGSSSVFSNSTIRQTLYMTIGGDEIRVRFSNAFGVNDLHITAATVALPAGGLSGASGIIPTTLKTLTFSGSPSFVVPNGALVVSDPILFPIESQQTITVTLYLAQGQDGFSITSHPGSRTTTWISFGDYVQAENMTDSSATSLAHWYFVSAVETFSASASAFVVIGDSITDGQESDPDKNNRWPDLLCARMQKNPGTAHISISNQAAGGNCILTDGKGPNSLSRVDCDVLMHTGVKYVMIYEGVNNINKLEPATAEAQMVLGDRLIAAFKQVVARLHAAGIPVFTTTITPFSAPTNVSSGSCTAEPNSCPTREATQQRLNVFIRTSGLFDTVINFDRVVADPAVAVTRTTL